MENVLHSTREEVSNQQRSEFAALNSLNDEVFTQLCRLSLDLLLSPPDDITSKLENVATSIGSSMNTTKNLVKVILAFFRASTKQNLSPQLLESDLQNLGLSEDKVAFVVKLWTSNFLKICTSLLSQTFTVNRLIDLEWKFGVTAASSDIEKVGSTFLQLKLVIDVGTTQPDCVTVELSLPQFYEFLHEMEKAKTSLDALS